MIAEAAGMHRGEQRASDRKVTADPWKQSESYEKRPNR